MPTLDPTALRHSIDDGMIITRSAIVVALDNWIILRALSAGKPFDAGATTAEARSELGRIETEQRELSRRASDIRTRVARQRGSARHGHDYKQADDTALALRSAAHAEIADRLAHQRDDKAYLAELVEDARRRAWADVGSAILGRIGSPVVGYAPEDDGREDRLREFREVDLAGLLARSRAQAVEHELDDRW
ncbi:hypothetical protein [Lacisediminihabitans changchengi]|uniref:Asparagine synthase n=1 Tax=Lacisediminihabitans changchengi TaxID=2787634 RepID=A0A934SJK3_9MICO|nr:hypothetical protein [Lacisediminihabitans changchengi]MBK4346539.1 hypothetical protein [Lacisediminihabitans changchengi]